MNLPFALPPLPGRNEIPVWQDTFFLVGREKLRILDYGATPTGWTDELTEIHEDVDDENHYINVASRARAVSEVIRWTRAARPLVLDIGCSSGYTIKLVRERMPDAIATGADCVLGPLEKVARDMPGIPLFLFDLVTCPLPEDAIDAVISLNVLEHIKDDAAALHQIYRILKPGGIAAIEVPAGPGLFDIYDSQLMHQRRYRMRELVALARQTGFTILDRSHLGFFLYPAFWVVKKRNRLHLADPPEKQRQIVSRNMRHAGQQPFMHTIMRMEEGLRSKVYYPLGIRCVITCQKPARHPRS